MSIEYIILISVLAFAVLIVFGLAVANFAGESFVSTYNQYKNISANYIQTLQFSQLVSNQEFNGQIKCNVIEGFLNDHYVNKTINLSQGVAYSSGISNLAVAAHELGHAIQYRDKPQAMKKFTNQRFFANLTSKLVFPFFLFAVIAFFFNIIAAICLATFGVLLFIVGLCAKLATIKIEKEASRNALVLLQKYAGFENTQLKTAAKVLKAAALTYVASFLKSVLAWTMLVRKYDFY